MGQQLSGIHQPALDLGQPVGNRLLEHATRILKLVEMGPLFGDAPLEFADAGIAPVHLDLLARRTERDTFELGLKIMDPDRVLGAQAVLVGAHLGLGQWKRPFQGIGR